MRDLASTENRLSGGEKSRPKVVQYDCHLLGWKIKEYWDMHDLGEGALMKGLALNGDLGHHVSCLT